jgi:hypothetical protein
MVLTPEESIQMEADRIDLDIGGKTAFKVILRRLDEAADKMLFQYDSVDYALNPEEAIRIQMYRRIVKVEIPRIVENIKNHNQPKRQFSFFKWLFAGDTIIRQ